MNYGSGMKAVLGILILLITVSSALALSGWESFQDHPTSRGFVHDLSSTWDDSPEFTASVASGSLHQPLVADFDGDGNPNVMQFIDNFLVVFEGNEAGDAAFNDIAFALIGNSSQTEPALWENPSTGQVHWVTIANNQFWDYTWTGGTNDPTYMTTNTSILDTCNRWAGLKCVDDSCYALCENTASVRTRAFRFNMTSGEITAGINLTNGSTNVRLKTNGATAITTVGSAGPIIGFACDANGDGQYGVCAVKGRTLDFDTTFSSDGIIDQIQTNTNQAEAISNPVWMSDSGAGLEFMVIAYQKTATCGALGSNKDPCVSVYTRSGTNSWTTCADSLAACPSSNTFLCCSNGLTTDNQFLSQPFVATVDDDFKICLSQSSFTTAVGTRALIGCLDATDGSRDTNRSFGIVSATSTNFFGSPWSSGQIVNNFAFTSSHNESDDYLYFGNIIVTNHSMTTTVNLSSTITANQEMASFYDVDGAGNGDILTSGTTVTRVLFQVGEAEINDPPTLFQNMTSSGYYGYYTGPICKGTTITYRAQECPGVGSGCNYNNDLSDDTERLKTDCGYGNTTTGSFAATQPTVNCLYNTTGTFSTTIYLQDDANPSDLSQYNTESIIINVIDGIPGSTCNLPSGYVNSPNAVAQSFNVTQAQQQDTDICSIMHTLIPSNSLRTMIGLLFCLVIAIAVTGQLSGKNGPNGMIFVITFVIAMGIATLICVLSPWIIVFMFLMAILGLFFSRFVTSFREQGG